MVEYRVNWSSIVWDLIRSGLHVNNIARHLCVSRSAVIRWRDYNSVPHWHTGNRLLNYWGKTTNKNPLSPPKL